MENRTRSSVVKSTPTRSTPQKRRQDSVGGTQKKAKFDLSYVEEECKRTFITQIPSFVMSMGSGDTGQLGLGEDVLEKKRPALVSTLKDVIEVRAGGMHSICLSKSGQVYTFGCNDEGALGRTIVEDEDATVPGEVKLPDDIKVIDITAGDNHSSILTEDGKVYIWGSFRDNNGLIGLLKPFEKLSSATLVPVDKKIIKIASGENHFAMLSDNGEIFTFGCAEQGQLGRVSPNNLVRGGRGGLLPLLIPGLVRVRHSVKFCDLWAGSFCTIAKSTTGEVYGCGLNNYKQLGVEEDLIQLMMTSLGEFNNLKEDWKKFAFGQHHTIALSASNRIYVIGRGEYGNLGQGDNEHRTKATEVMLDSNDILTIAACNRTSYALMNDGTVYSWGMGSSYQLGHGDDEDVNVPTKMVGKQVSNMKIIEISPGFQHVLFRAVDRDIVQEEDKIDEVAENQNEKLEPAENPNLESKNEMEVEITVTEPEISIPIETDISEETVNPEEKEDKSIIIEEPMPLSLETVPEEMVNPEEKENQSIIIEKPMPLSLDTVPVVIVTAPEDETSTIFETVPEETAVSVTNQEELTTAEEPKPIVLETIAETTDEPVEEKESDKGEINDTNNNALDQMEVEENQES